MNRKEIASYCKKCHFSLNVYMLYCNYGKKMVPCTMVPECPYKAQCPASFDREFHQPKAGKHNLLFTINLRLAVLFLLKICRWHKFHNFIIEFQHIGYYGTLSMLREMQSLKWTRLASIFHSAQKWFF